MNISYNEDQINLIGDVLVNPMRPLKERFRALFTLKCIGGERAIKNIASCFSDSSELLKHELAYCLGQTMDEKAIPILINILKDVNQEPIVRHEAAEGLGAIGNPCILETLKLYSEDPIPAISETCQIALNRISWLHSLNGKNGPSSPNFISIDPAPPLEEKNIMKLEQIFLDKKIPIYERYRAMFALRNINTPESAKSLVAGFKDSSALFRHEVAYVLGQMAFEIVLKDLATVIENKEESDMVRHEAVEALGAIATDDAISVLKCFLNDDARIVRESCEIALDMCDYENSDEFQCADSLLKIKS